MRKSTLTKARKWAKRKLKENNYQFSPKTDYALYLAMISFLREAKSSNLDTLYIECRSWIDFRVPKRKRAAYADGGSAKEPIVIDRHIDKKKVKTPKKATATSRKEEYNNYINKSPVWKAKRKSALSESSCCAICSSTKHLHVHHRKYPKRLGTECIDWLTVLCSSCHMLFHENGKLSRG